MYSLGLNYANFWPFFGVRFCLSSPWDLVSLVSSVRYNGLEPLALAAFGRVRALCACYGPFGPAIGGLKTKGGMGGIPSLKMAGMLRLLQGQGLFVHKDKGVHKACVSFGWQAGALQGP